MKMFRISSLTLIGVPRSSLRKIASAPANLQNYKINEILNEQSIESVIEETVEIYQDNDPNLKLLTVLLFTIIKSIRTTINYSIIQTKMQEIIIRLTIQYFIHEFFYLLKPFLIY